MRFNLLTSINKGKAMEQLFNQSFLTRIGCAIICGFIIGIERQIRGKPVGIRTSILICLGTMLFIYLGIQINEGNDSARILGQVVTGVGFICAGTIIRSGVGIKGLTTAAGLWTVSGIGLACGLGYFEGALISSLIILFVFVALSRIGRKLGARDI